MLAGPAGYWAESLSRNRCHLEKQYVWGCGTWWTQGVVSNSGNYWSNSGGRGPCGAQQRGYLQPGLTGRLDHVEWFGIDPQCHEKSPLSFYHWNDVVRDGLGHVLVLGGVWRIERQGGALDGSMRDCGQGARGEAAVYNPGTKGGEQTGPLKGKLERRKWVPKIYSRSSAPWGLSRCPLFALLTFDSTPCSGRICYMCWLLEKKEKVKCEMNHKELWWRKRINQGTWGRSRRKRCYTLSLVSPFLCLLSYSFSASASVTLAHSALWLRILGGCRTETTAQINSRIWSLLNLGAFPKRTASWLKHTALGEGWIQGTSVFASTIFLEKT